MILLVSHKLIVIIPDTGKKSLIFVDGFVIQLGKITINVGTLPDQSISFTIVIHVIFVYFVRKFLNE